MPEFSVCSNHKAHSLGIEGSEPPVQFDGIYKIAKVFGSILKLNESPTQFLLSGNMTTFLGIFIPTTTRK